MNPENIKNSIQAITDALAPIASKIGESGKFIFDLAVRQVYVEAATSTLAFIIFLILLIPYSKFLKWGFRIAKDSTGTNFDHHDGLSVIALLIGIGLAIWGIIALVCFLTDISALFNPQWKAFEIIFQAVKSSSDCLK